MPRVGPSPITDRQRVILRDLVDRGSGGITLARRTPMLNTLRALRRRGLAEFKDDGGIFRNVRYVATAAGIAEAHHAEVPR